MLSLCTPRRARVRVPTDTRWKRARFMSSVNPDYVQESAMRFNGGRAASIRFVEINNEPFLLLCSLTRGAVLMRWHFQTVKGIMGVNSIDTDSAGTHIVAVSASTRKLSLMTLHSQSPSTAGESLDVLGQPVCMQPPCLISRQVLEEEAGTALDKDAPPNLLGGARHVEYRGSSDTSNTSLWLVQTSLAPPELLCASGMPATVVPDPSPPFHGDGGVGEEATAAIPLQLMSPPCQSLSFLVAGTLGDLDLMFEDMPRLHLNGSLTFSQKANGWGVARFAVTLKDSAGGFDSSFFEINIAPVAALSFELLSNCNSTSPYPSVCMDAVPHVQHEILFARNLSLGSTRLSAASIPSMRWHANVSNHSLFVAEPQFVFRADPALQDGVVGAMVFQIQPFESGSTNVTISYSLESYSLPDAAAQHLDWQSSPEDRSAYGVSAQVDFELTARPRNYPPAVEAIPDLVVAEDAAPVYIPCWLRNLTAGSPYEASQTVGIYRTGIEIVDSFFAEEVRLCALTLFAGPDRASRQSLCFVRARVLTPG